MKNTFCRILVVFIISFQSIYSQAPTYIPSNGLIAFWPFNGNANDLSGNTNNGNFVGAANYTTDRFGASNSSFQGGSSYITFPSTVFRFARTDNFTVSLWFTKSTNSSGRMISTENPEGNFRISGYVNSNLSVQFGDYLDIGVNDNGWHNLIYTYENRNEKVYVDGVLVTTNYDTSNEVLNYGSPFTIGAKAASAFDKWNGKIDDVAIWNRVLTSQEINNLFNSCTTIAPVGNATQVFCSNSTPTVASLTATGAEIQWYISVTGGSALASSTALVDGTTYYASQTISGCESNTRFAVTVDFNDPQIAVSSTSVCSGAEVVLTASTTITSIANNCTLPTNLQNGLIGYWPFCGNANDTSGNNNNGTVNGSTLTSDRFGNTNSAYGFDGNDFIALDQPFFNGSTAVSSFSYSFSFYINQFPVTEYVLSAKEGFWRTIGCSINNNGIIQFRGSQPSPQGYFGISSTNAVQLNQWNTVVITFESGNLKLYINGVLNNSVTISYTSLNFSYLQAGNSTSTNYLGAFHPVSPGITNYLNGKLDDFAIWDRSLSLQEVQQLHFNINYLWSTGETSATINPTPTATTTYWCDVTVNGVTCRKDVTITVNPIITPTFTQVTSICSGTTMTALPETSNNGITGTWSPSLNNTVTTNYIFTPIAGQCATIATMTITVNVNPITIPAFTQELAICSGATLSALPTTSINNITGTWSPALNNRVTTTYTFTPTPGQCATTATMTIEVNPTITPVFTQVAAICKGASLSSLPTTSNNSITGTWSPVLNILDTTTYTFTPTPGQCSSAATMTITVNPIPNTPTGVLNQKFCSSDSPTLSSLLLNQSLINWYSSITSQTVLSLNTPLVDGETYYATQFSMNTDCQSIDRIAVKVDLNDVNTPSLKNQTFCLNDLKTIEDIDSNGENVLWYESSIGGEPLSNKSTLIDNQVLYVSGYDKMSNCESNVRQMFPINLIDCELSSNNLLTLNGNNLNDNLNIKNIEYFSDNHMQIFNRSGQLVWKTDKYNNTTNTFLGRANCSGVFEIDKNLPTGTYFYVLNYYNPFKLKFDVAKSFFYINNNN